MSIPPEHGLRLLHWDACLNVDPAGLPLDEAFAPRITMEQCGLFDHRQSSHTRRPLCVSALFRTKVFSMSKYAAK